MSQNIQNLAPLPAIGTQATLSRTITEDDILLFALVSGDHNPIHLDAEYAEKTLFGKRIAHGFLIGSLISAVLGNDMPGPGSIYLGQTLKFLAPIHIGDTVTVTVKDQGGHYVGSARIKQTEFGIKPVKVAGGTVKVKDELHIDFDIQLAK